MRKVLFILGQLSDSDVDWLAKNGKREKVAKGTELIKYGVRIETLYFVLDGEMEVLTNKGVKLAKVSSGDVLGEMSLIDSSPTAASIKVDHDATVLALPMAKIRAKLEQDVGFAARFYKSLSLFLADRMRNTIRRMGYEDDEAPDEVMGELDEIDPEVLDNVHLAGARFERMLKILAG
jgi:CRP/FNR family cyclic AMP-dependent transcriptional regulator